MIVRPAPQKPFLKGENDMFVLVCDICGKPIDNRSSAFKVKKYREIWCCWERIDIHDDCVKMLLKATHKETGAKEKE